MSYERGVLRLILINLLNGATVILLLTLTWLKAMMAFVRVGTIRVLGNAAKTIGHWVQSGFATEEERANAHLIAAAPEMYRMIESLRHELYQMIDEVNDQRLSRVCSQAETPPDLIDMESIFLADKLLTKARGET